MIRIEILTVFLTMPLTVAVMQFMTNPQKDLCTLGIFLYFVINSIRFFQGDVNLYADLSISQKDDLAASHNAVSFFIGVASKFCFLLAAYCIADSVAFFAYNGLCYLFDLFWLTILNRTVDPTKPRGGHLLGLFKSWLILDGIEAIISFAMSIVIYKLSYDPKPKEYLEIGTLGVLGLLLAIDYLFNARHYFQKRNAQQ
ncbi:MAG: hypothetical protein FVQ81_03505 [Candidatus Glassbacteria bacterium]|nr:hypothetical protein [Candidatus Glassbacteria bacterium]